MTVNKTAAKSPASDLEVGARKFFNFNAFEGPSLSRSMKSLKRNRFCDIVGSHEPNEATNSLMKAHNR